MPNQNFSEEACNETVMRTRTKKVLVDTAGVAYRGVILGATCGLAYVIYMRIKRMADAQVTIEDAPAAE